MLQHASVSCMCQKLNVIPQIALHVKFADVFWDNMEVFIIRNLKRIWIKHLVKNNSTDILS